MVGKEPETGQSAKTVAANVKRLRTDQDMSYTRLSEKLLERAGWALTAVGVRRIETGERRVTPDDLVALAIALNVSPATLLMPPATERGQAVTATGVTEGVAAELLWRWLSAGGPLPGSGLSMMAFGDRAWPRWEHDEADQLLNELREQGVGGLGDN